MKSFEYMEFDNDNWYFDQKKYTKQQSVDIYNEESGLDPVTIEDVEEGKVCWFPKKQDYPDGCYVDVTNTRPYMKEFPVWVI